MNSGWPPETPLAAEGVCTEWVPSKTTGAKAAHDGERAHVDDEVVVAEAGSALGEEDAGVAGRRDLFDGVVHVPGGDELAFLDVDGAAGLCGGDEQVGLAAEEGGDLEDVDGFGGDGAVGGFVDVGEDGKPGGFGEAAEDGWCLRRGRGRGSCGPRCGWPCRRRL